MKVTMRGPNMGNTSPIRTALLIALITATGLAATGRAEVKRARSSLLTPLIEKLRRKQS